MRPIAMLNQKGGVGKTTSAVNVAAGLARAGQKVLLLDLDPQSHTTMHLGIEPDSEQPGIYDVLVSAAAAADALRDVTENLSLLPAHLDLVGAELELTGIPERELVLRRALAPLRDRFDTLIIDCPPSLGTLTINALAAADEVVIPLQPHFLALQGLGRLLETVSLVRGVLNPALRITGVILCMFEKGTRLALEVENDVREFIAGASPEDAWHGARVFDTHIRRNVKLAECPSFGQTIFDYAPTSHGAEDYAGVVQELLEMTSPTSRAAAPDRAASAARSPSPSAVTIPTAPSADPTLPAECLDPAAEVAASRVVRQADADLSEVGPPGTAIAASAPAVSSDTPGQLPSPAPEVSAAHDPPGP